MDILTAPTEVRTKAKQTLEKFHGAQAAAALAIGVKPVTISLWLRGQVQSKKLDAAVPAYAAGIEFGLANAA